MNTLYALLKLARPQVLIFLLGAGAATQATAQNTKGGTVVNNKTEVTSTDWPAMPTRPADRSKAYGVPVTQATPEPPPNDPLHEINQSSQFRGILAYAPKVHVPQQGGAYSAFVLRGVGLTKNIAGQPSNLATYMANVGGILFNPHFSPDGRYIAYGEGEPGFASATNDFYVWDLAGKQISLVNPRLQTAFTELPWSPDSTHLAFAINVYESGDPAENYTPRLYTYNLVTKKNFVVAETPLLTNPLGENYQRVTPYTWTSQGNLLFAQVPEEVTRAALESPAFDPFRHQLPILQPNIYAVPPDGGKTTLIISEGYNPAPSPDGKWIAYFGWYNVEVEDKTAKVQNGQPPAKKIVARPGAFLFDKANKKRILIRPLEEALKRGQIPSTLRLRWTPDSQRLILVEISRTSGPEDKSQAEAHVSSFPISATLETEKIGSEAVAVVKQSLIQPIATLQTKVGYDVQEVSRDGQFLFFKVSEGAKPGAAPGLGSEVVSMQAVNLRDGTVSLLARFYNNGGGRISDWGWYDLSTPAATAKTDAAKTP